MTQIDEPNLDEKIEEILWVLLRMDWHINHMVEDLSAKDTADDRQANVEEAIKELKPIIANQVREATDKAFVKFNTATLAGEKEARIDELNKTSDTFDTMHQKTEGGGFVHYGEFGEYLDDRIKELGE